MRVRRATGRPFDVGPYIRYLNQKYGEIYDLEEVAGSKVRSGTN